MPAYCVAANCNNRRRPQVQQCTSSRAIDPQWGESGLSLYNSNELTFLLPRITPIWVASTSVSAISQTPWNTAVGFASKLTRCSGTLSKSCLIKIKLIRLYPCRSLGQSISFVFGARVGHFAATPQSDVVGIWSRDLGVMATLSVWQKMPLYNPQITVSPTSSFWASFNGNGVSKITPNLGLVL